MTRLTIQDSHGHSENPALDRPPRRPPPPAEGRLAEIGITELRFESAEPSVAAVRSRFPAGEYILRGHTVEGASLVSRVTLSHRLLSPPTFSPRDGQMVDKDNAVVRWNAPGAEQVEIIIENTDLGHGR